MNTLAVEYVMVTGLFFAFLLIYFKRAKKWNIVDVPNHRSQHSGVTLRGGSIVYPFAFLCFLLVWVLRSSDVSQNFFVFGLGLLAVCSISFWDDIRNLSGKVRALVHFFAVTLLLVFTGSFNILPLGMIPVVYILMIGILNAYNFMDGINGMTGLYSFVTLGSLLYVNEMIIHFTDTGFIVYPILATTVFLFFNFRKKAKCFMGDVGSIGIAFWVLTLLMLLIPTVKILLATYNGEKYIIDQIQSILDQRNVLPEIVLSDDGSKDSTIETVQQAFPQIRVNINIPGTGSAANNFLKMLSEINFDDNFGFVGFADQDDIWLPDKLEAAISKLTKKNAQLYCSNLIKWDLANNSYTELKKDYPQKKFDYLFEGGSAGCTYVFTKQFALELKNFIINIDYSNWKRLSHDWLVYFFARSKGYKVVIDGNSYIHYRLHGDNVHGHLNKFSWEAFKFKLEAVFNGYYDKHVENYIKYLPNDSEAKKIYSAFLKGYFPTNFTILKNNFALMRDKKKFLSFAIINLLKFK